MGLVKPAWPVLQSGHTLARGLVGAWAFYEAAGSVLNDLIATNNGVLAPGVNWIGSPYGSGVATGGNNVTFSSGSGVSTGLITVAALIIPSGTGRGDVVTCWHAGSTTGDQFDLLFGLSAGKPQFFVTGSAVVSSGAGSGTMAVGTANLMVGTYDSANVSVYLNGSLQSSAASSITLGSGATNLRFANNLAGDGAFTGSLIGVWIWNRALSAAEVAQLYADPFAIYRKPSRWWEVLAAAGAAPYTPYDPWPLWMPLLSQ